VAWAQSVPTTRDQDARPGGQVSGLPPLALVKVAEGFNDPVGVYERTATDVGVFEAVFGGALGAVPFRDRMAEGEILRLNAYVGSLGRDGS
jgi:hypothetical protein